jgi:hypothetical protein
MILVEKLRFWRLEIFEITAIFRGLILRVLEKIPLYCTNIQVCLFELLFIFNAEILNFAVGKKKYKNSYKNL